jgi:PAS domain S-box-containing protein
MTWRTHDLSQIIEQIPIGVAVTLPSGVVEYVNPHLSAMLRSPPAQLEGVDLADLRISGSSSQNERMRRRLLAREPWREEAQFVTASGDKLPLLESA